MSTVKADRSEVLRYLGYKKGMVPDEAVSARIDACEDTLLRAITPKSVQKILPLTMSEDICPSGDSMPLLGIGAAEVKSRALAKHLQGCSRVLLFAATLGIEPDRLIQRAQVTKISDAVLYQALAAAMIESYCDSLDNAFRKQMQAEGCTTRSRFSPGYGDLPLDFQRDVIRILDTPKTIGLTLTDALLMMPSKSVTAIIGIKEGLDETGTAQSIAGPEDSAADHDTGHKCRSCSMTDCPYRDTGN